MRYAGNVCTERRSAALEICVKGTAARRSRVNVHALAKAQCGVMVVAVQF